MALVNFQYSVTLDGSLPSTIIPDDIAGDTVEVELTLTFDSDLENQSLDPDDSGIYSPISGSISINDEAIENLEDGTIRIGDIDTTSRNIYRVEFFNVDTTILSNNLEWIVLALVDEEETVLRNGSLPTNASFVNEIDGQTLLLRFEEGDLLIDEASIGSGDSERTPFTLTSDGNDNSQQPDNEQNAEERDLGNYTVNQISEEDIIDSNGFISGNNVFWLSNSEIEENGQDLYRPLNFNANSREATQFSASEPGLYLTSSIFTTDYAEDEPEPGDQLVFTADDGSLSIFDGSSLVPIPNSIEASDVTLSGDFVIWRSEGRLLAYNSQTNTTEVIADNSEGSSLPGIGSFDYVASGNNVAWLNNASNPQRHGFLYDGETTIQVTNEFFRANSNLQMNGNSILMTGFIDTEPENPSVFRSQPGSLFYNGETIAELPDFEIPETQNITELLILENSNFIITAQGDIEQPDGTVRNTETLYLYNGNETQVLYEIPDVLSLGGIEDLTIEGDNIVWIQSFRPDGFETGGFGVAENLYLYNLNNENAQPIILNDDGIRNRDIDFQVSENQIAWVTEDSEDFSQSQNQLYVYDQENVVQLTDLVADRDNDILDFNILDNGIIWVANDDGGASSENAIDSDSADNGEVFLATFTNEENNSSADDSESNEVYRFFNQDTGVHFYTGNETERDAVLELPNYSFEGASYESIDPLTGNPEPLPVYRFLNQDTGVHLYTISEVERDATQELDNFSFEGEAFFAYSNEVDGSIPIYRFFNTTTGAHFYTPSIAERDNVEANLPDFQSEGVAYYAFPVSE